jgi:hypothetical protein
MGASVSKTKLLKNNQGVQKMNEMLEKTMQQVLLKYSEMVADEMDEYYKKLIIVLKEPQLELPLPPVVDLTSIFNKKCDEDLVAVFEKKLNKFPKYAIESNSLFGTSLSPIMMDLGDNDGIPKQLLCKQLSELFVTFLNLIQSSVTGLIGCRTQMDTMIRRLNGNIAESKANLQWFKKMKELQDTYTKQLKSVNNFMNKLNGVTIFGNKKLNNLINEMNKLSNENKQLPQKCQLLVNELQIIKTIDDNILKECDRLNIPDKKCNSNAVEIAIQELEQQQNLASEKLLSQRTNLNSISSAITSSSNKFMGGSSRIPKPIVITNRKKIAETHKPQYIKTSKEIKKNKMSTLPKKITRGHLFETNLDIQKRKK